MSEPKSIILNVYSDPEKLYAIRLKLNGQAESKIAKDYDELIRELQKAVRKITEEDHADQ